MTTDTNFTTGRDWTWWRMQNDFKELEKNKEIMNDEENK